MEQLKVSVIVPIYNMEKYLTKCIQSIINQTYHNIEIILVNDGSTDRSDNICQSFCKKDNRIIYIKQNNQGVSIARNNGLRHATGVWVAFVDGDDWLSSDMLTSMISCAGNNDVVVGDVYVAKENRLISTSFFSSKIVPEKRRDPLYLLGNVLSCAPFCSAKYCSLAVPWAKIYRGDFLKSNHLTFPMGIRRMQDMIFNINVFTITNRVGFCSKPIYYYRIVSNSVTRRFDPEHCKLSRQILSLLETPLLGSKDPEIQNLYYFKKVWLLLEELSLCYCHSQCNLKYREKVYAIKRLFSTPEYASSIEECETKLFSRKQQVIIFLIRRHLYAIIPLVYMCKKKIDFI